MGTELVEVVHVIASHWVVPEYHLVAEYASRPGIGRIELLTQTSGSGVPSYSYSCSLRCFSLSYSSDVNELWDLRCP